MSWSISVSGHIDGENADIRHAQLKEAAETFVRRAREVSNPGLGLTATFQDGPIDPATFGQLEPPLQNDPVFEDTESPGG